MPLGPRINGEKTSGESEMVYQFGQFTLNTRERTLKHFDHSVHIKPKVIDVLIVLLAHANQVVSKDELMNAVWRDAFVEDANLAVHVSTLRKLFRTMGEGGVQIETVQKLGYRLKIKDEVRVVSIPASAPREVSVAESSALSPFLASRASPKQSPNTAIVFLTGLIVGLAGFATGFFLLFGFPVSAFNRNDYDYIKTRKYHSFKIDTCPQGAVRSNLVNGGCEEAVSSFSLMANPNGNWSYGYTLRNDIYNFVRFQEAVHNNHYYAPEVPSDIWRRPEEWHPSIFRNTSGLTVVLQDGVVVPPHMFEMHPGPNGERSVLRWTAPTNGHFRVKGQFRGINTNGDTTTDALIVYNSREIRFSENIEGYNIVWPFELTFRAAAGDTIDFSVGFGANQKYECDSTGFSAFVTTISLAN